MSKTDEAHWTLRFQATAGEDFSAIWAPPPTLTALGGTGLLSSLTAPNALASTGPLDAAQRQHRAL